jgi:hypothetical protein
MTGGPETYRPHWCRSLVFNATGAVLSGIVFVIEGVTKFTTGAWVAIVLIAAITVTALRTRRYYLRTGQQLALRADQAATPAARGRHQRALPPSGPVPEHERPRVSTPTALSLSAPAVSCRTPAERAFR